MKTYFEFADSFGFFNSQTGGFLNQQQKINDQTLKIILPESTFLLTQTNQQAASLTALSDSYLMDFVIGYSFPKEQFDYAIINGQKINHRNSYRRRQYPVNQVNLVAEQSRNATISITSAQTAGKFTPVMYVRDLPGQWIVHCRLLPTISDKEIIKINWPRESIIPPSYQPLPQKLNDFLLQFPAIKNFLWYRNERPVWKPPFKPCAYPLAQLKKGETVSLTTQLSPFSRS